MIRFQCPRCGKRLKVDDDEPADVVLCPACKMQIEIDPYDGWTKTWLAPKWQALKAAIAAWHERRTDFKALETQYRADQARQQASQPTERIAPQPTVPAPPPMIVVNQPPPVRRHSLFQPSTWILGFAIVVFVVWALDSSDRDSQRQMVRDQQKRAASASPSRPKSSAAVAKTSVTIDKSPDKQAARRALISQWQADGYLGKMEQPGTLCHLWVKPLFYTLSFEHKQKLVGLVYAYWYSDDTGIVVLKDEMTGKTAGTLDTSGLDLE